MDGKTKEQDMFSLSKKIQLPAAESALPGREQAMSVVDQHAVNGHPLLPPFPMGLESIVFGLGCFWGAERRFWQLQGVYSTSVGYSAGYTPNPSYQEVCSGMTGHNEVVLVVFDPQRISLQSLLAVFWEAHDPTQGMRQGNDVGTQYRSGVYTTDANQHQQVLVSAGQYAERLKAAGFNGVTTEVQPLDAFYYAEEYHQQYLHKNPNGYCGLAGTGVRCE